MSSEANKVRTIKDTAIEMYLKKYNVNFISRFLGVDVVTIKSWVLHDDPKKQFKKIEDVPDSFESKQSQVLVPVIQRQMIEDMPAVIKGLTLVGYSLKDIAEQMKVSEELLLAMIGDVEEVADAYHEASTKINMKMVETLIATLLPHTIYERTYKNVAKTENGEVKFSKELVKEVRKDVSADVAGIFKWLEKKMPDAWGSSKSLGEFLKEAGIALVPDDVEEAKWEEMATTQQTVLKDVLVTEKDRLTSEYSEQ